LDVPTENNPEGIGLENVQAKGGMYDGYLQGSNGGGIRGKHSRFRMMCI